MCVNSYLVPIFSFSMVATVPDPHRCHCSSTPNCVWTNIRHYSLMPLDRFSPPLPTNQSESKEIEKKFIGLKWFFFIWITPLRSWITTLLYERMAQKVKKKINNQIGRASAIITSSAFADEQKYSCEYVCELRTNRMRWWPAVSECTKMNKHWHDYTNINSLAIIVYTLYVLSSSLSDFLFDLIAVENSGHFTHQWIIYYSSIYALLWCCYYNTLCAAIQFLTISISPFIVACAQQFFLSLDILFVNFFSSFFCFYFNGTQSAWMSPILWASNRIYASFAKNNEKFAPEFMLWLYLLVFFSIRLAARNNAVDFFTSLRFWLARLKVENGCVMDGSHVTVVRMSFDIFANVADLKWSFLCGQQYELQFCIANQTNRMNCMQQMIKTKRAHRWHNHFFYWMFAWSKKGTKLAIDCIIDFNKTKMLTNKVF